MNNKQLSFIETAKSFRYSINIKFDIGDFNKINSFIPTAKNIELFKQIFNSFNKNSVTRAHILIGAYGTGKSLFGTLLGSMLAYKDEPKKYDNFINKINRFSANLANKIDNEIDNKLPYLLVLPSTDHKSFKQSMLLGLQNSLKKQGLEDIFPKTHFKSVENKLQQWKQDYQGTYKSFKKKLKEETGESIEKFKEQLKLYDQESYKKFINWYPELTSGGSFNSFYGCSLDDIYLEVNKEIKSKGYQGIFVIFDEFNKLLEDNLDNFNGKKLQDFAEMATRSGENEVHLLLISHKKLLQYATSLPQNRVDEWKKIEGRFKTLDASQYSSQIYELMSNVIIKEKDQWQEFMKSYQEKFDKYMNILNKHDLCPDYTEKEKEEYILYGCYPLHPLTTILLPKLSQKIAQNERTIFTFLSTTDRNTLGEFVQEYSGTIFPVIRPSKMYDYFEGLMQQEFEYTQIHQAWANSQRALQKVDKSNFDKIEFIKALGIINAVNNFSLLPPSKDILKFALDYMTDIEFEKLVNELIKDKIILYRKSKDRFIFFEGSEIDFNKKIKEKIEERKVNFSGKYLLNDYFKPNPIYPKKYNDEYKIRRYFVCEYLYLDEVMEVEDWEEYFVRYNNKSYVDGMVVYLLLESNRQIEKAKDIINEIQNERVLFVLPKKVLNINEMLQKLDAQLILLEDKELLEQDSLAEKELKVYIKETKQQITNELDKFVEPHNDNALFMHKGKKEFNINSRKDLSKKISNICSEIFNSTPVINNELIVKNNITAPQKSARKEIVKTLLFNKLKERLNITGYGPEFLIYRTLFIKPKLLVKINDTDNLKFNPELKRSCNTNHELDEKLKKVINFISNKLFNSDRKIKIGKLYDKLRRPPFGLRLGVMPILLIIAGRLNDQINYATIRHNGEEKEINEKLFEEINQYPDRYTIEMNKLNLLEEKYIGYLEKLFDKFITVREYNEVNRLNILFYAMKKWYQSLPKYSRETNNISKESIILRKILDSRTEEIKSLLLKIIPQKILGNEIETAEQLTNMKNVFNKFFKEENQALNQLITELQLEVRDLFIKEDTLNLKNSLINWYDSLTDKARESTYSREINSFLNIIRKLKMSDIEENDLLKQLSLTLTGFNIADWNDDTVKEFLDRLDEIKKEIEGNKINDDVKFDDEYEFVLIDKSGSKYKRRFEEVELDGLAAILNNRIRNSFNDMGDTVSDKEKQQILINLLKEMFNEEGVI